MSELSALERDILMVFRVTGFFGKTPKKNVSRNNSLIWRGLQASDTNVSFDDIAPNLTSLAEKGLLRLDDGVAYLTDEGYAIVCSF